MHWQHGLLAAVCVPPEAGTVHSPQCTSTHFRSPSHGCYARFHYLADFLEVAVPDLKLKYNSRVQCGYFGYVGFRCSSIRTSSLKQRHRQFVQEISSETRICFGSQVLQY
ncbi:hypothetical protein K438DRAFT_1777026 [Mycena galopus ATCC 62051]|nr:hypothetical protein K438DRAFT_1777026 [Mycena galopus ATCC 62051]